MEATQKAFKMLKDKMMKALVLAHPNLSKPFKLEVDASGFTIGAVVGKLGVML
jgi:hypothetical protein